MRDHNRVITCSCGETFDSEEKFEQHKERERRREFNDKVQQWLDEHVGGRIAEWHSSVRNGGIAAYGTAKHNNIGQKATDENVREAAIQFAEDSLTEGNRETLFYDEYHD